ncbi:hypothetical protein [Peterkaempfera bronchialis]|uniref:hypothetical protein n=1 Tax=Peterkaempfera bronchialis TaxID=2126346 RepID=UPI003C2F361E
MRVKLRPGSHFAPTEQGLYCRFHGSSFVLRGPSEVFRLFDSHLGALTDGTDLDALIATEQPSAAAVLRGIVGRLLERGLMLDLDTAGGPVPDAATAARHEDLLSHLEEHCARPYEVFAEVRAARVAVRGGGPAAAALTRALESFGIGLAEGADPARLTVLIDDVEAPADLLAVAASLSGPGGLLPLVADEERIVVGPVLDGAGGLPGFASAVERVALWNRTDPAAPPPRPVGAVLAGSLAARRVLDRLTGIAETDDLLVVHGHTASVTTVPFTPPPPGPHRRPLTGRDLEPAAVPIPADASADTDSDGEAAAALLTAPWRGTARWLEPAAGTGRPIATAALRPVAAAPHGPLLGWGGSQAAARRDAVLALLRAQAAMADDGPATPGPPLGAPWTAAAGTSTAHLVLDGVLRLLATEAPAAAPERQVRWQDLGSSPARALWSALDDYHGSPVELTERRLPGLDWSLVCCQDRRTGDLVSAEWGPTTPTAAHAALGTAFVTALHHGEKAPPPTAGAWCVELLPVRALHRLLGQVREGTAVGGRRIGGRLVTVDPVFGRHPLPSGRIWLA